MVDAVSFLDRAPARVRRLVYGLARGEGVLGRLADAVRYRFSDEDIPMLPPVDASARRFVIGPANSAGQGYRWAHAVNQHVDDSSALSMHGIAPGPFRPEVDLRVPTAVYQRSEVWHRDFEAFLSRQTHVLWESGLPLLGRRYGSDASREMELLAKQGVEGAWLFHGSDIRPPSRHAAASRWSPFRTPGGPVQVMEETAARNSRMAAESGAPVFVSTPDLLRWVPGATWCPVVVDTRRWREEPPREARSGPLVVVHAPSQRWLKGTDLIEPVLARLASEGVIEYRQITGASHASMPQVYASADIVLDQFVLGIYGVAACEAMASGRLVMSHVDDETRAEVRQRTGWDLPVHETSIDTLEREIRRAAEDPAAFDSIRQAGPAFVDDVHDGRRSAGVFAEFLGVSA